MFKHFIATQFKKPSGLFGLLSASIMMKANKIKYEKLIKDMDLQPAEKILEIGYGPGIGIDMIARACPSCTVHGIDFSDLMYRRASKYNKKYLNNNTVLLQYGDFIKTPFMNTYYNTIFCLNVIYFWDVLQEPFKKVFALLKTGGAFYAYIPDRTDLQIAPENIVNPYTIEQVVKALTSEGFADVVYYSEKGYYIKATKR